MPNPRNEAEAISQIKRAQKEMSKKLMEESESQVIEIINWAEEPITKKVREAFARFEKKILKIFKANQWSEAEGRGIAYTLQLTDMLEDIIDRSKSAYKKIQDKRKRERQ